MDYIRVTKENIDREHICCAMSGKQSLAKKEWLKQRFEEGLVFYRSAERGKCFIEYKSNVEISSQFGNMIAVASLVFSIFSLCFTRP